MHFPISVFAFGSTGVFIHVALFFFSGCCLPISRQFLQNGFGKGIFFSVSGSFYATGLVFSEVKKPLVITKLPTQLQDSCKLHLDTVSLSDLPKCFTAVKGMKQLVFSM